MPEPPQLWLGGLRFFNVCSAVSYFSTLLGSIIGAGWLSFRVRDGSGRFPAAMAAVTLCKLLSCPVYLVVGWVFLMICVWLRVFVVFCKFSAG